MNIKLFDEKRKSLLIRADEFFSSQGNFEQNRNTNDYFEWAGVVYANDDTWPIQIRFSKLFPIEPPSLFCNKASCLYLRNPHIFEGGYICLFSNSASINCNLIEDVLQTYLYNFKKIIEGESLNGFQEEFSVYWNRKINKNTFNYLISPPSSIKEYFYFTIQDETSFLANSREDLKKYLLNIEGKINNHNTNKGICLNLDEPLLPSEYPKTVEDVLKLAQKKDIKAYNLLINKIIQKQSYIKILIRQYASGGFSLGCIDFISPKLIKHKKSNKAILISNNKILKEKRINRTRIIRIDYDWIHSRGGTGINYSKKSIAIIGCGSVGGYIAHTLSKSGVGKLLLIDNDILKSANIGRHILGSCFSGFYKSQALQKYLATEMPHLSVDSKVGNWLDLYLNDNNIFQEYDIVISTIADWKYEKILNQLAIDKIIKTLILSWLEPNAIAGHCFVSSNRGCLNCYMNDLGQFEYSVTDKSDVKLLREPGGCTFYQPYGPSGLLNIVTLTCKTALNSLKFPIDSILYSWISDKEQFKDLNTNISDYWKEIIKDDGFSKVYERKLINKKCEICKNV